jgi:cytoskeletal protein CcmA (bactofilin family)
MQNTQKPGGVEDFPHTILGPESSFEGKLVFKGGQVVINGEFKGDIKSESTLIVGESARLEADIDVGTIIITGEIVGDITATRSVSIERMAKVRGTITTPELEIKKGVVFEGHCRMEEAVAVDSDDKVTRLHSAAQETRRP